MSSASSKENNKKAHVSREEWERKGAVGDVVREVDRSLGQSGLELHYPHTKRSMKSGAGEELLGLHRDIGRRKVFIIGIPKWLFHKQLRGGGLRTPYAPGR